MGLFDKLKKQSNKEYNTDKEIFTPVNGNVISLKEINDGVFSEEVLGKGCGIMPESEDIYAPFDGEVVQVADTKHAIGIKGMNGIEILIHVGIDTVTMNGSGFSPKVREGDIVRCGDHIMNFSKKTIEQAGFKDTIAIIVVNSDEFTTIRLVKSGKSNVSDRLLEVQ